MPDNFFDPHFDGLPPSKSWEEVEFFYFLIYFFLLEPFLQLNELNRLASEIVAEAFLADGIILEVGLLVFLLDGLVVDYLQLINVILLG